ncbi:protein-glutamine gamma-glutamyltransferase E-like isoform X2 [Ambystoma mexicanum]|uniref:protein-glutamine gamma-glutamyltransferase E-like isoform X2 n=1 Tax=Ambystoma mexicanum TaxID=8296 RepID=UPI0037E7A655
MLHALKLKVFDLLHQSNGTEHHTDNYNSDDLVVRRGQPFKVRFTFNRGVKKEDKLQFVALTGSYPLEADNTHAVFPLTSSQDITSWAAVKDADEKNGLVVKIYTPATAVIGHYKLSVKISSKKGKTSTYKLDGFTLLFNPWCPDDDVFLDDEAERQEYVLNDNGMIFFGQEDFILNEGWNFGQFEESILSICLAILDKNLNYQEDPVTDCSRRNDPVYIGRVVTTMVNHFEDDGVVMGRWKGSYIGGVDPMEWIGSVDILKRWKRGGYKPVKYGQCWVFGGVTCTVLRCLGIPTRIVTNFLSAHDTNRNLWLDQHFDTSGQLVAETSDSVWNFHVWNESWFLRHDLGSELSYSGWQVLDSTPQETSTGIYRCGPASVNAVKQGDVELDYDVPFVFAEVNADRVTWILYDDDLAEQVYTDTKSIGQKISTKALGSDERVDITSSYKYPEGSEEERAVFQKARQKLIKMGVLGKRDRGKKTIARSWARATRRILDSDSEDDTTARSKPKKPLISGKFKLPERPMVSEDINLSLILKNLTASGKTINVNFSSSTVKYTGQPTADIWRDSKSITLKPHGEERIPVQISALDYEHDLTSDNMVEVAAVCEVKNGGKLLVRKHVVLDHPPLGIEVLGEAVVNEPVQVEVTFTNPLPLWVKDGRLLVEGSGLIEGQLRRQVHTLEPRESSSIQFEITPSRSGSRQLLVVFTSKRFPDIKGFQSVEVVESH